MEEYYIDDLQAANDFVAYLKEDKPKILKKKYILGQMLLDLDDGNRYVVLKEYGDIVGSIVNKKVDKLIKKDYIIVDNKDKLQELVTHINTYEHLAFDVESTGLNTRKDVVIGFSISGQHGVGFYYPIYTYDVQGDKLVESGSKEVAIQLIKSLKNKKLYTWNGSYDVRITKNSLGVDLTDALYVDGMLLKHTLQEEGPFGLKPTGIELQKEIGLNVEEEANKEQIELKENVEKNGGSTTKTNYEMYKADLEVMGKYAAADADLTLRICDYYLEKLAKENLEEFFFSKEVMPLYKEVTIPMEDNGVKLDLELLQKSKEEVESDIKKLRYKVISSLFDSEDFGRWYDDAIEKATKTSPKGKFGQKVAEYFSLDLPISKSGNFSLTKKNLERLEDSVPRSFLLGEDVDLGEETVFDIKEQIYLEANDGLQVNISSKKQMGEIVFDYMNIKPLSKTDKGSPQFNDKFIDHLAEEGIEWAKDLHNYNRLIKIKGAYIDRFLDNHEDGYYYFSYKQHGTISGRYGSDAQQLPRPLEEGQEDEIVRKYVNRVRAFFIADEDMIFIDCDYESLEPHVFAHISGDEGLRDIFRNGHDFYSTIAIATESLEEVSADKKAENYLGKVDKQKRQQAKGYALGVPYGMGAYALGKTLGIDTEEAQDLIDGYLDGFPDLKEWMERSKKFAQKNGYIVSEAGRVRHLPKAKELFKKHGEKLMDFKYRNKLKKRHGHEAVTEAYKDYKNSINNSRNFQVQSMAGSVVNAAAIAINRKFKKEGIKAYVCAQIHDQLIIHVPEDKLDYCKEIVQDLMESTTKLSLALKAPPEVSKNWRDGH